MATLRITVNPGDETASLDVDCMAVGGISKTGRQTYSVDTGARVPAIDGVTGDSVQSAWDSVKAKVRTGGVALCWPISTTDIGNAPTPVTTKMSADDQDRLTRGLSKLL